MVRLAVMTLGEVCVWGGLVVAWLMLDADEDFSYSLSITLLMASSVCLALGNCLNYGQLKALPQEICTFYSCGLATSQAVSIGALFVFLNYGVESIKYFLPLALLIPAKFICQDWFGEVMKTHAHYDNIYKLRKDEDKDNDKDALHQQKTGKKYDLYQVITSYQAAIEKQSAGDIAKRL